MRLALTVLFVLTATVAAKQPEGALGVYPAPKIVRMAGECPGFVLSRGKVNAATHEWDEGSFNVGHLTVTMPRAAIALLRAKDLDGTEVEIVIRAVAPRALERIER
jgi:hypothetical protein